MTRFRRCQGCLVLSALLLAAAPARTQTRSYNERDVKRQINVQDTPGVWVLDFTFKDPRYITVDVPGRGRKLVWYLWYQVSNSDDQPHTFIPSFELVTLDTRRVYHDQVLPKVQDAIAAIEDPTTMPRDRPARLKNSVTIASEPIPPSKGKPTPRKVTGVAIWDDIEKDQKLQDTNQFSIFVSGLSNGWSIDDKGVVRRKTLQLNFRRLGDRSSQDAREIHFVPPAEWLYRAAPSTEPQKDNERPAPARDENPKK